MLAAGRGLASQLAPASPKTRDRLKPRVVYWQQIPWQRRGALLAGGLRSAAVPGDSFYSYLKNKNKYAWWKHNQLLRSSKGWRLTLPASTWRGVILETAAEGMLFSITSSIFPHQTCPIFRAGPQTSFCQRELEQNKVGQPTTAMGPSSSFPFPSGKFTWDAMGCEQSPEHRSAPARCAHPRSSALCPGWSHGRGRQGTGSGKAGKLGRGAAKRGEKEKQIKRCSSCPYALDDIVPEYFRL